MFQNTIFELNWTFWIFVLSFLLFMKALNAVFLKPVGQAIAKRKMRMEDDIATGLACKQQAASLLEGYEKDVREIRSKAQALINETTGSIQKERVAELKRLQDDGQKKLAEAKKSIDQERLNLIDQLVDEEKGLVETIVHKLLGNNVPVKLDQAAIKQALEEAR